MKHYILTNLVDTLKHYTSIHSIRRVSNNTLQIEFNGRNIYYFDMTKGNSLIYKKESTNGSRKKFNAPFDIQLQKIFNNSYIENISLVNNDKILSIKVTTKSAYKKTTTYLQLEFTGKHTNAIIVNDNNIVLEALRHIDEWTSVRIVKVGSKLLELEKPNFIFEEKVIKDIDQYLYSVYANKEEKALEILKKQKQQQITKQISKIEKILSTLDDIEILKEKAKQYNDEGIQLVSILHTLNGYQKDISIKKSNDLFLKSKKTKQKIKNQHIEQNNLTQKLDFYNRLLKTIHLSKSVDEIEFYFPKKDKNQTKTKKAQPYQSFFIDTYKIMLGRDERENIYLLENSRASDFWFHLKDMPSSHLIVTNTKKTIPEHIIERAAFIVAQFSTDTSGSYLVDYTQRRNVKIQSKANVLYNPYNTIKIKV
jgi:predicted ribosome quality control (RQC) complex YloA/Tae2 family protein